MKSSLSIAHFLIEMTVSLLLKNRLKFPVLRINNVLNKYDDLLTITLSLMFWDDEHSD